MLYLFTPFLLPYYINPAVRDFTDDEIRVCTIVLHECIFAPGTMFVLSSKHSAFSDFYVYNPRLENLSSSPWFRLPQNTVDDLEYFSSYKFSLQMNTDPVRAAMIIHRHAEVE